MYYITRHAFYQRTQFLKQDGTWTLLFAEAGVFDVDQVGHAHQLFRSLKICTGYYPVICE